MSKDIASRIPKPAESVDKLTLIRNHPLFRHLGAATLEQLAARMIKKAVRRGAVIFAKGDPGVGLIGVMRGSVKISVMAADGREAVFNIVNAGEIFGEMALLDGRPRSADATAMADCDLVSMDRGTFIATLRGEPDGLLKVIEFLCARLRRTNEQVQDVMFLNAPARLAKTLLQLADKQERKAKITQRDISQIIGLSREMTNKQLRIWERANWVKLERGGVVLVQPRQLEKIAAESSEGP
jgi:CRP/FNR family transcriptional regulator, cyclic AMP receptor protein